MVTPRGVVIVNIAFALTLVIVTVLFGGIIYQRPASRRNTPLGRMKSGGAAMRRVLPSTGRMVGGERFELPTLSV